MAHNTLITIKCTKIIDRYANLSTELEETKFKCTHISILPVLFFYTFQQEKERKKKNSINPPPRTSLTNPISRTIRPRRSSSPWSSSLLTTHGHVFRRILKIASTYVVSLSRDTDAAIRLPINPRDEGGRGEDWRGRDGRMEEGRVEVDRDPGKREEEEEGGEKGWRAEGLLAEGDEKSERKRERNWGTVLSMHSGETRTLHFPPPLLLLPPLKLPHTHSRLCSTNRTVFGTAHPSPPLPPSRIPTCIPIHTRTSTPRTCVYSLGDWGPGAGGTIIQHPTLDPLIIHTYMHNTYTYTWAKLTFAYQRDRSPPPTVSATFSFFLFAPPETSVRPPLLPLLPPQARA